MNARIAFAAALRPMPIFHRKKAKISACLARASGVAATLCWPLACHAETRSPPTFADDVAEILYGNCVECHRPGGVGPFSLASYEDARRRSRAIAEVTQSGFMPPWMPSPRYGPELKGERRLSEKEIDTLVRWRETGSLPGNLDNAPDVPEFKDGWTLGEPDLVLTLPRPYKLAATGKDEFRSFVIPVPLQVRRYVKALQFQPQPRLAVHHAVIAVDPTSDSRERDAADPELGFGSMDLGGAGMPFGHIIGWAPGQVPYQAYPGTAWPLDPGTDLVAQLHMLPTGKVSDVDFKVGLYLTDEEPRRQSMVIHLRENKIDIPPGEANYEIEESITIPVATEALSLFPHAHYLGKDMRIFAELPNGETQWLLRIPEWDFNWQSDYRFEVPLPLPSGTRLVMRYSYDNSADNFRNPSNPPVRVQAGWGSFDEMGEVAVQVLLNEKSDWVYIQEAQSRYDIANEGRTPSHLSALANALRIQERYDEAIDTYEELTKKTPNDIESLLNLAEIYSRREQHRDAADTLASALALKPSDLAIRLKLAGALSRQGESAALLSLLVAGLPYHNESLRYRLLMGNAYMDAGRLTEALKQFDTAVRLPSANDESERMRSEAYYHMALIQLQSKRTQDALQSLDLASSTAPDLLGPRMLKTRIAISQGNQHMAKSEIKAMLSLPDPIRPSPEALINQLPFPAGALALSQAQLEMDNAQAAKNTLIEAAIKARIQSLSTIAETLEDLAAKIDN